MAADSSSTGSRGEEANDDPRIETNVSNKTLTYSSIIAFLAWAFAVYDYTLFGTLLPVMADDLGWSTATSTAVVTLVGVGVFAAAMTVGPMLDYLGRKTSLILVTIGAALSSGLTALSFSAVYVVIVRAFSGLGYAEQAVNAAYLNELYGNRPRRGLIFSFVQGGWPVGVLLGAAISAVLVPIIGWRGAFLVAVLPSIIVVALALKLKESPRFEAMKHVKKLQKEGNTERAREFGSRYDVDTQSTGESKSSLRQIFGPGIRKHTIFLSSAFLCNWIGVQVFAVLGTTVLTEGKGVSFGSALTVLIVSNAATYIGYVLHGLVGDIFGRRRIVIIGWIIASISYSAMLFGPNAAAFVLTTYTIGLFFTIGPYAALLFYMSESFPANMRGTGTAFANAMGPLGAIVGSALLTALLSAGLSMVVSAFLTGSVALFLSGVLLLGAREVEDPNKAEKAAQSA